LFYKHEREDAKMVRRVFFGFHYKRDIWRASQVRNSWVTKPDREAAGFWDAADWEKLKKRGDVAVKRWINKQLEGTSVTAVLIGAETYSRRWVRYEIARSFARGNGLLGIHIHKLENQDGKTDRKGYNPLDYLYFRVDEAKRKILIWEWDSKTRKWCSYPDVSSVPLGDVSHDFGRLKEGKFSEVFPLYDFVDDDGYENLGKWVERAAKKAGR